MAGPTNSPRKCDAASEVALYSGAEVRIGAAFAHLADLWSMADAAHSLAALEAMYALLISPIGRHRLVALQILADDQLGSHGAVKLFHELGVLGLDLHEYPS